ncbi:hypothetical protein CEXT_598091 [Caerostris extrusa]|uniref:Uncharacterized protein n=1 Tax=Caerostris extrusa TaxID=172846 RepID=A0AAV4QAR2_CAEEX|nr:hypothetical protein CEXT_598091 [Caerostris extrusa]
MDTLQHTLQQLTIELQLVSLNIPVNTFQCFIESLAALLVAAQNKCKDKDLLFLLRKGEKIFRYVRADFIEKASAEDIVPKRKILKETIHKVLMMSE